MLAGRVLSDEVNSRVAAVREQHREEVSPVGGHVDVLNGDLDRGGLCNSLSPSGGYFRGRYKRANDVGH
eukprot:6190099-Prorocentrum_lima.AAC.1